jgi:3-dehydroquinate synthase
MPTESLLIHVPSHGDLTYPVEFGVGLADRAGERLRAWGLQTGPLALVSEQHLLDLHGDPILESLQAAGFEPVPCPVPGGEPNKTLQTLGELFPRFAAAGLDRGSPIVALGGGVIGDLAGFAAATWLRGVPFVQVPTSLLAMVDSSVGGKTAVDLPQGKNLVGAFKQPEGVLIDPSLLTTLPPPELRAGLGEVVKHGLIGAPDLFAELEANPTSFLDLSEPEAWVTRLHAAVAVKAEVVTEDPLERGRRAVLNLGHTFGHAFELCSGYSLRHGEAVAIGLVAAAELSVLIELANPSLPERVRACLSGLGLPVTFAGAEPREVRQAMAQDKKRRAGKLRFVVLGGVGEVQVVEDPGAPVLEALARVQG